MRLEFYIRQINAYLNKLDLSIKPNWYISDTQITFLGYRITKQDIKLDKPLFHKLCRLWKRMKNYSIKRAKTLVSLWGWFKKTTNYYSYYLKNLLPIMSFETLKGGLK